MAADASAGHDCGWMPFNAPRVVGLGRPLSVTLRSALYKLWFKPPHRRHSAPGGRRTGAGGSGGELV
eukprot:COSAG01_NODE_1040_length_11961_cov_22.590794_16_plen_67_part_00